MLVTPGIPLGAEQGWEFTEAESRTWSGSGRRQGEGWLLLGSAGQQ